jgi:hypothetical protein
VDVQIEFETSAVKAAAPVKRDGYLRLRATGSAAFETYRQVILRDHFDRTPMPSPAESFAPSESIDADLLTETDPDSGHEG